MEIIDNLKAKLKKLDDTICEKYMYKTVLDSEKARLKAYKEWKPMLVKIWLLFSKKYEFNPHDLTVPLHEILYHLVYVKKFSVTELVVIAETFQKYAKSNAEITMALGELHEYRGLSPYKRKLFHTATKLMSADGLQLDEALNSCMGDIIDEKLILSIRIGMESNHLEESLTMYLEDLDFDIKNNSRIKKALAYPAIIIIMIVGICVAGKLMFLPSLFEPLGISMDALPSETKPMMFVANLVLNPIELIKLIIFYIVLSNLYKNSLTVALIVDIILLKIPVVGDYLITKDICFFFRNLHSYVNAGSTTIEAHIKACDTLALPTLRIIFESKKKEITEGATLSQSYMDITYLKEDIKMILSVAEKNGALSEALETSTAMLKLAYQTTTDRLVDKIPTFSTLGSGIAICVLLMPLLTILYNLDAYIT